MSNSFFIRPNALYNLAPQPTMPPIPSHVYVFFFHVFLCDKNNPITKKKFNLCLFFFLFQLIMLFTASCVYCLTESDRKIMFPSIQSCKFIKKMTKYFSIHAVPPNVTKLIIKFAINFVDSSCTCDKKKKTRSMLMMMMLHQCDFQSS